MSKLFFSNESLNNIIKKHIKQKLSIYNDINYAYAIMNKSNPANFSIITNLTEWFDFYKQNNFQFIDPVLITALYRVTPFSWDENIMVHRGVKVPKIFDKAKHHDIINGYTFVLHDHLHNLAVLSLMMDRYCGKNIEEKIESNKNDLQMLLVTVHQKLTALYQEHTSKKDFDKINAKKIFSKRENEIIYWASVGKSYQEIALILGIKLTTVKYHIGNAVKKLGVTNAKHAIRLGVELQLIRPVFPDGVK